MQKDLIWLFLICQLTIQTALYLTTCRPLLKASIKPVQTLLTETGIDMCWLYKIFNISMIICNLLISFVVLKFTQSGAIAGITNLTASVILGLFMALDVHIITRRIKYAKQTIKNSIERVTNTATIAYHCVGATIDTINDKKTKDAWMEKKFNCKEITKKHKKALNKLYKEYKSKVQSCNKSAYLAKREVNLQFSNTVKKVFAGHLQKRRSKSVKRVKQTA